MTNLLIALPIRISDSENWENILNKFDEKDFYIYEVDGLNHCEYDMGFLAGLVEYYKSIHDHVDKIVVISDARDLIFSWFRCFNSLIDDYIYFIDNFENNLFSPQNEHYPFYYNMFEFNGINAESIDGKIFLSKRSVNFEPLFFDSRYFDYFDEYDFFKVKEKKSYNRKYVFNNQIYDFVVDKEYLWKRVTIPKIDKKILFLKGDSQYDVLRVIIEYNSKFFRMLGFEVVVLDLSLGNQDDNIKSIVENNDAYFLYSTNSVYFDILLNEGGNLYDFINLPVVGTLGDHPVNQYNRVNYAPQKCLFLCLDNENINYFEKYFPNKKIATVFNNAYPAEECIEKSFINRNTDILFAGSLLDPSQIIKEWKKYDGKMVKILNSLIAVAEDTYFINVAEEIEKLLIKNKLSNCEVVYKAIIHSEFERYWRYYKRYKLLEIMSSSDLKILCIGDPEGLNKLNKNGNFIIQEKVEYQHLLKLMSNSKMVLNMTGHLYYGITERVLSAMINGAVAVTEEDRFTTERFSDGENIVLYNYENVIEKIKNHLNNLDNLEIIAQKGKIEAINSYDFRIGMAKLPRFVNSLFSSN